MRKQEANDGLSVNAIAGSYVVLLGIDIADKLREGLRGFAIQRTDHEENETYWLSGMKVFQSVVPHPAAGGQYSSLVHPFQSFQWADYSAKPKYKYTYKIVAMYGEPANLEQRTSVEVTVTTEAIEGEEHAVFFNRGSPATQEYARRFHNKTPDEVGQAAYDWLSRGLIEGMMGLIKRAEGEGFGLKGAFYEFQWPGVLNELHAASERGVDVDVVFDDIDNETGPHGKNEDAIAACKLKEVVTPRTNGTLMHNKFLVLTKNKKPLAVLFGSTNLTENGIFGHANCAHITENAEVAANYLEYYGELAKDPETGRGNDYKPWVLKLTPAPPKKFIDDMAPVFSPRPDLEALEWFGELADGAKNGLFMAFAFGMNKVFQAVYGKDDSTLRFALMEKEWNGRNKEAQIETIRKLQARSNVVIAIGNRIPLNGFDQWLAELDRITNPVNVHWVHLKFMLADPLSDHPIVIIGSANFSDASTKTNDENMLVIKDNQRVADIYLGEYMRLFSHYAFREAVQIFLENNRDAKPEDMKQGFLIENGDWTKTYFDPKDKSARMARRLYFAGKA